MRMKRGWGFTWGVVVAVLLLLIAVARASEDFNAAFGFFLAAWWRFLAAFWQSEAQDREKIER